MRPRSRGKLSLRASITGEIVMEDVFVPAENLLPNVEGLKGPFGCLNNARYGISWGVMGAAEACWHAALEYTLERKQFGAAGRQPADPEKLADMQTEIGLALQGCLQAGRLKDNDALAPELISCSSATPVARPWTSPGWRGTCTGQRHLRRITRCSAICATWKPSIPTRVPTTHALILGRSQTGIQAFY